MTSIELATLDDQIQETDEAAIELSLTELDMVGGGNFTSTYQ